MLLSLCINYIINSLLEVLRFPPPSPTRKISRWNPDVLFVCVLVFLYDTFCVENCETFGGGGGGGGG